MFTPTIHSRAANQGEVLLGLQSAGVEVILVPLIGQVPDDVDGACIRLPEGVPATFGAIAWPTGLEPDQASIEDLAEFYADFPERAAWVFHDGQGNTGLHPVDDERRLLFGSDPRITCIRQARLHVQRAPLRETAVGGGEVAANFTATGEIPHAIRGSGGRLYVGLGLEHELSAPPPDGDAQARWLNADEGPIRIVALRLLGGDDPAVFLYAPLGSAVRVVTSGGERFVVVEPDGSRRAATLRERDSLVAGEAHDVAVVTLDVGGARTASAESPGALPTEPPPPTPVPASSPSPHREARAATAPARPVEPTPSGEGPPEWHRVDTVQEMPDDVAQDLARMNEEEFGGAHAGPGAPAAPAERSDPRGSAGGDLRVYEIPVVDSPRMGLENWHDRGRSGVLFAGRILAAAVDPDSEAGDESFRAALDWARLSNAGYRPPSWARRLIENALSGPLRDSARQVRKLSVDGDKYFARPLESGALRVVDDLGRPVRKKAVLHAVAEWCGVPAEVAYPTAAPASPASDAPRGPSR